MILLFILILALAVACLTTAQIWSSYLISKDPSFSKFQLHRSTICTIQFFGVVMLVGGVFGTFFC